MSVAVLTSRGEPLTPEEQREADEIRAVVESKNSDLTQRIALFCGPGNNGGDGIAAARLLFFKGVQVRCFLVGTYEKLTPDSLEMTRRLSDCGVELEPFAPENEEQLGYIRRCDAVVDASAGRWRQAACLPPPLMP